MITLGLVSPLPPTPSGPADYVAGLLVYLAGRARVVCFVPDPLAASPALRRIFDIRPLSERGSVDVDVLVYHVANTPLHAEIVEAARAGPPGLIVLHDASIHHVYAPFADGSGYTTYRDLLEEAHGERGVEIAELRGRGERGEPELFLFDLLAPLLARHLGCVVHSRYTAGIVEDLVPGLPVRVIPHHAGVGLEPESAEDLGLPPGRFVVGHLGFVTPAKRADVLLGAAAILADEGIPIHVVFAGEDLTWGPLDTEIAQLDIADRVTVTGFVAEADLDRYAAALDVVVSLRWPHVGETSGTLMRALAAGNTVVVQDIGPWAELPHDAAARVPDGEDDVTGLASILRELYHDPDRRRRLGEAGKRYAETAGDPEETAERYAAFAEELLASTDRALRVLVIGAHESPDGYDVTRSVVGFPLPFSAGSFDLVVCDTGADLAEANRVLRASGRVRLVGSDIPDEMLSHYGLRAEGRDADAIEARKVTLPLATV